MPRWVSSPSLWLSPPEPLAVLHPPSLWLFFTSRASGCSSPPEPLAVLHLPSLWLFFTSRASGRSSPPILANSPVCPQVDKHGKVQLTNTLGLKGSGKALYPRKEDVFLHSKQRSRGRVSNRIPPYSAVSPLLARTRAHAAL